MTQQGLKRSVIRRAVPAVVLLACSATSNPSQVRVFINLSAPSVSDADQKRIKDIVAAGLKKHDVPFRNPSWGQYDFVSDEAAASSIRDALVANFLGVHGVSALPADEAPLVYPWAADRALSKTLQGAWFRTFPASTDPHDFGRKTTSVRLAGLRAQMVYCLTDGTGIPRGYCAPADEDGSVLLEGISSSKGFTQLVALRSDPAVHTVIGDVDVTTSTWTRLASAVDIGMPLSVQCGNLGGSCRLPLGFAPAVLPDPPFVSFSASLALVIGAGAPSQLVAFAGDGASYCAAKPPPAAPIDGEWKPWPKTLSMPTTPLVPVLKLCAGVDARHDCAQLNLSAGTLSIANNPVDAMTSKCDPSAAWQ